MDVHLTPRRDENKASPLEQSWSAKHGPCFLVIQKRTITLQDLP